MTITEIPHRAKHGVWDRFNHGEHEELIIDSCYLLVAGSYRLWQQSIRIINYQLSIPVFPVFPVVTFFCLILLFRFRHHIFMKLVRTVHYRSIILFSTLTISLFLLTSRVILAQGIQARVRYVTGVAQLIDKTRPGVFTIKRKDQLEPGNIIETGYNGRVVISLSDGSQITVLPNSKVILKDYPAASSARELLDILVGRVRVKIHHIGGKPNPYRLNSPSASIAVRGTEFIVDVLQNGETLVVVQEGQVEVWPRSKPDNKRLVTPGERVVVRLGGDISLAFPGPGSELNGRTRLDRGLAGAYQYSVDSVVQNSIDIPPTFLSAFPDSHLDSLENPAYAAEFENAEGRLLLLPSVSKPYFIDEDRDRFDYSISPQLTFYTPIPGSRFTVGGSASALRTRLQNLMDSHSSDSSYYYYNNDDLRFNAFSTSFIAAYRLDANGRTSVGISIDNLSGDGAFFSEYRNKSDGYIAEYLGNSDARFTRKRLTLGLFHKFSGTKKLGIYYRHGLNSSDQNTRYKSMQEIKDYQEFSYNESRSGSVDISTVSSEAGIRFRARMTRRLVYGIEGSYLYERINSRFRSADHSQANERDLARRARLGVGAGFTITPRILLGLDFTGGLFNTTKPTQDDIGYIYVYRPPFYSYGDSLVHEQGKFLSAHAMVQANPWRNLFVSASNLTTFRKRLYTLSGEYTSTYGSRQKRYLTNIGIGWRFKPDFIAEYLFSIDHTNRRPSHSLMLRYTFNLNVKDEK
jgi:FecR protein